MLFAVQQRGYLCRGLKRAPSLRLARRHQGQRLLSAQRNFQRILPVARSRIDAGVRQNHDRRLQALRAVHGQNPHRIAAEERAARAKAHDLLDLMQLGRLADSPARFLSGGQRKLLELARVMMADPALILLDEPAAGVNPSLLEVLIDRIKEIIARGVTFLLIEHNIDMVTRLCNRLIVMANGSLLSEGAPDAVASDPRVIEAYLGGAAA